MFYQSLISRSRFILVLFALFSTPSMADVIIEHITTVQAAEKIEQNAANERFHLIDVRTMEEFNAGHIAGATVIDFYKDDFAQQLQKLDKDKSYLLYCRTGRRSGIALNLMQKLGFKEAYNMKGGIKQWKVQGLTVTHSK